MMVATFLRTPRRKSSFCSACWSSYPMAPLGVRPADVQRHLVHALHPVGDLGAPQDEPDLRAVAVPDGEVPAGLYHLRKVPCGIAERLLLVLHRLVTGVTDERVPAYGDDRDFLLPGHDGEYTRHTRITHAQ